jgi:hypothetical protein
MTIANLREQTLRTRVMFLEYAINRYLHDGDRDRLARAYSNEWVQPLQETDMTDPFSKLRKAAREREKAHHEWQQEVKAAHAAGFSLRAVAEIAGVSHDTVWRTVK